MNSQTNRPAKMPSGGFIRDLSLRIRLILRLMADKRVFPLLKLIPVGTLAYLVIPDLVIGPLDDAAVIGIGMAIFVELCPQYIVDDHKRALGMLNAPAASPPTTDVRQVQEEDVLEGEFRDVESPQTVSNNGHEKERHEQ